MIRTLFAYSLILSSICGLVTMYWWWKHTDKVEKVIILLDIAGTAVFAYAMLL